MNVEVLFVGGGVGGRAPARRLDRRRSPETPEEAARCRSWRDGRSRRHWHAPSHRCRGELPPQRLWRRSPTPFRLRLSGARDDASPHPPLARVASPPLSLDVKWWARAALVATTVVWTANNVLVKLLYARGLPPGFVTAARFSLSALFMLPMVRWSTLRPAFSLSLTAFGGNASLAMSLLFTTTGRASFFSSTSVVLTPLLEALLFGTRVTAAMMASSCLCLGGVYWMSREGLAAAVATSATTAASDTAAVGWRALLSLLRGDLLALMAAFWFALYTVRLSREAPKYHSQALSSSLRVWTACLASVWATVEGWLAARARERAGVAVHGSAVAVMGSARHGTPVLSLLWQLGPWAWAGLAALAVLVILGALFQVFGQKSVPSQEAAVLYTLNPVWTSLAGRLFLAEQFTRDQALGGACILLGCLLAAVRPRTKNPGRS